MEGTVSAVKADKGFGFISNPGEPDVFFHRSELADDLPFDEQLRERRVEFDIADSAKGPRAVRVRAAE